MTVTERPAVRHQSVDSYLSEVLAAIRPLPPRKPAWTRPTAPCSPRTWPRRGRSRRSTNAAMDGYAVVAADVATATPERPVTLPVRGEVAAGDTGLTSWPPAVASRS